MYYKGVTESAYQDTIECPKMLRYNLVLAEFLLNQLSCGSILKELKLFSGVSLKSYFLVAVMT